MTTAPAPAQETMVRKLITDKTPDQLKFYVDLLAKVRALPEWKEFMAKGAFRQTTMSGQEYFDWLAKAEQMHRTVMRDAGFLAK